MSTDDVWCTMLNSHYNFLPINDGRKNKQMRRENGKVVFRVAIVVSSISDILHCLRSCFKVKGLAFLLTPLLTNPLNSIAKLLFTPT